MTADPFVEFKAIQKDAWGLFIPVEIITTPPAGHLVSYAKIKPGEKVLDVACGTGVVAVTAARQGAKVKALDLSPVLLEKAKWNAHMAEQEIEFTEGDAEALPYKDGEFDVVLSQFGHMFAPRPQVVVNEMLRVLKPGGRIAFSTWPPELFTGRLFTLVSQYLPPAQGVAPPSLWGDPKVVKEYLGDRVKDLTFGREVLYAQALSPQHFRHFLETTVGPVATLVKNFSNDSVKLTNFRKDFEKLISDYFVQNVIHQHFLMTKAKKV